MMLRDYYALFAEVSDSSIWMQTKAPSVSCLPHNHYLGKCLGLKTQEQRVRRQLSRQCLLLVQNKTCARYIRGILHEQEPFLTKKLNHKSSKRQSHHQSINTCSVKMQRIALLPALLCFHECTSLDFSRGVSGGVSTLHQIHPALLVFFATR